AACGTEAPRPGGDDTGGDDDGSGNGSGTTLPVPARGFQIVSPDITIPRGKEQTYCYYFTTPNTVSLPIKRWQSHMSSGSHHMILYFAQPGGPAPGTVSMDKCGGAGLGAGVWTYSTQTVDQQFDMPADDGTGMPLAQNVPAGQPAYFQ